MIRFTSMSRANISAEDALELGRRTVALGCSATVLWDRRRRWVATARKGQVHTEAARTTVSDALDAALDALEERERYMPEELVAIYAQSHWPIDHAEGE